MNPDDIALTLAKAKEEHGDYSMKATGHSLGGAIAILATAQLRLEHDFRMDVYTFGAPALGNDHLSRFIMEQMEGNEYRVTHLNDGISRLPPGYIGYVHFGKEYWLMGDDVTMGDTYPVEDVQVCEGMYNPECNLGTLGGDLETHYTYFGNIGACI